MSFTDYIMCLLHPKRGGCDLVLPGALELLDVLIVPIWLHIVSYCPLVDHLRLFGEGPPLSFAMCIQFSGWM
jgi:hypothetical protein